MAFLWPSLTHSFPIGLFEDHTCHLGLIRAVKCLMELDTHTSKRAHTQHSHSDTHAGLPATYTHRCCCTQLPIPKHRFKCTLGNGAPADPPCTCALQTPEPSPQSQSQVPPLVTFHSPRVTRQLRGQEPGARSGSVLGTEGIPCKPQPGSMFGTSAPPSLAEGV